MLKKYHRTYRICPIGLDIPRGKKCLSENELNVLLDGEIIIEEKIDGGVVGISWDHNNSTHLAIGKHRMIPANENSKQFYGFNRWIYDHYEKIELIPHGYVVYGEWMKASHQIFYDELPDYFLGFDIWDGQKYVDYHNKEKLFKKFGFEMIPALYIGKIKNVKQILHMTKRSQFSSSEIMEGVLIKNYEKQLYGKYVRREFMDSMEEHWLKKPLIENKLRSFKKTSKKTQKI